MKAASRNEQFKRYPGNWAIIEIMRTALKNKRNYRTKVGRSTSAQLKADDHEEDEEDEEDEENNDSEIAVQEGNNSNNEEDGLNAGDCAGSEGEGEEGNPDELEESNESCTDASGKRKADSQAGGNAKKARVSA